MKKLSIAEKKSLKGGGPVLIIPSGGIGLCLIKICGYTTVTTSSNDSGSLGGGLGTPRPIYCTNWFGQCVCPGTLESCG